jgi:hypothetical protein
VYFGSSTLTNFSHLRKKMTDAGDESFPAPVIQLQCGPIWKTSDMAKFKKHYDARRRRTRTPSTEAPVAEQLPAKAKAAPVKASTAKAAAKTAPKTVGKRRNSKAGEDNVTDIKPLAGKKLAIAGASKAG